MGNTNLALRDSGEPGWRRYRSRLTSLSEGLYRPIKGVPLRVGVQPAEQIRGLHFLQFDGRDHM